MPLKGSFLPLSAKWLLLTVLLLTAAAVPLQASDAEEFASLIGPRDALLVADPGGRVRLQRHAAKALIPASTLKLLTSLAALQCLGPDFRFATDFFMDPQGNLIVKGYGDPLLVSEVMPHMAAAVGEKIQRFKDLVLDASHFAAIEIPGVTDSFEPYDAPNGALCANFNTVHFQRRTDGTLDSGEPQTPMLSYVLPRIRASGQSSGRILLSAKSHEATRYAGHLLLHFLSRQGVVSSGAIRLGRADPSRDTRICRFYSPFTLPEIVRRLLAHSNNFIANQLLVAVGIQAYGPPGTLDKGVRAVAAYGRKSLGMTGLRLAEGSGISRANRITAFDLHRALEAFAPRSSLLLQEGRQFYKTGTLNGIRTRVGYLQGRGGKLYRFVVMLNSGRPTEPVMEKIVSFVDRISIP